ncbi:MAG: hypothetical protein GY869_12145 [Planctomycetes bacterium]|nr:hypothetical protein [Planctomycetota bacterium]
MVRRLIAISFIYVCTALGWILLAETMWDRTNQQDQKLQASVSQLWGSSQSQSAPKAYVDITSGTNHRVYITPGKSDIKVDLDLDFRKKGLLWYSTYRVKFTGEYLMENNSEQRQTMIFDFLLPSPTANYDNFRLAIGDVEMSAINISAGRVNQAIELGPAEAETVVVSYESQGMDEWWYDFGMEVSQAKNFSLVINTNFANIDFSEESISPTGKVATDEGWQLSWNYVNRLSGGNIGMVMPNKLNPGPWAMQVTRAAPVSLFLFFFLLMVFATIKKVDIHPMNYFFIGAAFFSFHLLLAYLVDHISIHVAFWVCSVVSIFLVVSYMRLVVGPRFAFREIAISQLVYLVLFSYTFSTRVLPGWLLRFCASARYL